MRALDLVDHDAERPARPEVADEPHPEFARMVHTEYRWCGNPKVPYTKPWQRGHLYSFMPYGRRVAAWMDNQLYGDGSLTLAWVENTPVCPHCERDAWVLECREIKAEQRAHDRAEAERTRILEHGWGKHAPRRLTL